MAGAVPENVIVIWPGNNSAIPSGWSRVTALDSKMTKGVADASTNAGTSAGGSSHTHTSSSHTHAQPSHTHSGNTGNATSYSSTNQSGSVSYAQRGCRRQHSHNFTLPAAAGPTSGGADISWAASAIEPPYYEVIYIKSDGSGDGFPDDCIVYYDSGTDPTDWTQHSASVDKYFRGAGSGGNGGGTGGNASHTHSYVDHQHNFGAHVHPSGNSGGVNTAFDHGNGAQWFPDTNHTHAMNATSSSGAGTSPNAGSNATSGGQTNAPARTIMNAIQNDSGGSVWLEDAYCLWVGNIADIPDSFTIADGNNSTRNLLGKFILNDAGNNAGHGGTTTGSTHGHNTAGHTPTCAHGHSGMTFAAHNTINYQNWNTVQQDLYIRGHDHDNPTVSNSDPGLSSTSPALTDNTTAEPSHVAVAYIMSGEEPKSLGSAAMFGANF